MASGKRACHTDAPDPATGRAERGSTAFAGSGRVSTGLPYSPAYDKPEQVYGRTVTIVTVRP